MSTRAAFAPVAIALAVALALAACREASPTAPAEPASAPPTPGLLDSAPAPSASMLPTTWNGEHITPHNPYETVDNGLAVTFARAVTVSDEEILVAYVVRDIDGGDLSPAAIQAMEITTPEEEIAWGRQETILHQPGLTLGIFTIFITKRPSLPIHLSATGITVNSRHIPGQWEGILPGFEKYPIPDIGYVIELDACIAIRGFALNFGKYGCLKEFIDLSPKSTRNSPTPLPNPVHGVIDDFTRISITEITKDFSSNVILHFVACSPWVHTHIIEIDSSGLATRRSVSPATGLRCVTQKALPTVSPAAPGETSAPASTATPTQAPTATVAPDPPPGPVSGQ